MAASDAIPVPRKNADYRFYFAIRKPSDSTLITTWAGMDSEVSKDGGAYADCTNEATEVGTSGTGYIDLTASEMNADCVMLKVTVTNTGSVPLVFVLYPEEVGDYRANAAQIGGQTASASGTVTFPNATLASTTNITAGTITTATNVTTVNGLAANVITATSIASNAITDAKINAGAFTSAKFAAGAFDAVWTVTTRSLTTFGTLVADIWANATRTITGTVTVGTNNDKTGYSLTATTGLGNQTANITGNLSGSVGSVTGAVGSVTGNVGGNVTGSVGSISGVTFPSGFSTLTVGTIADGVWDEAISGHLTAGSTGASLNAAGSAGDPWTTTLPGSYSGSQAGKILADILVDTGTTLQAELDGIQADTEDIQSRLPAALVSGRIDASVGAMAANVLTASALATDAVTEISTGVATYDSGGGGWYDEAIAAYIEITKIPRGASPITAGGNATRTKISANGTTLVEAIT